MSNESKEAVKELTGIVTKSSNVMSLAADLHKLSLRDYSTHNSSRIRKCVLPAKPSSIAVLRHGLRRWHVSALFKGQVVALFFKPRYSLIRQGFSEWQARGQAEQRERWTSALGSVTSLALKDNNDEELLEGFLNLVRGFSPEVADITDQLFSIQNLKEFL